MKLTNVIARTSTVAVTVVAAAAAVVMPAAASAPSVPAAHTVQLADGAVAIVQTYTGSQIAELPALPAGHHYASTVEVAHITLPKDFASIAATKAANSVRPNSASGCTPYGGMIPPYTCITVVGSGLSVRQWYTGTFINNPDATAYYEVNSNVMLWDVYSDAPFGQYFSDLPGYGPANFSNGTRLCNWWTGSAAGTARPCVTIQG